MKPDSSVKTWRWINTPRSIPKSITEGSQNGSSAESFCVPPPAQLLISWIMPASRLTAHPSLGNTLPFTKMHPTSTTVLPLAATKRRDLASYYICFLHHKSEMKFWVVWKYVAHVQVIPTSQSTASLINRVRLCKEGLDKRMSWGNICRVVQWNASVLHVI